MKLLPRILAHEDELDEEPTDSSDQLRPKDIPDVPSVRLRPRWVLTVAAVGAVPRLAYLFFFSDLENGGQGYTDAYHHWQVAYLTKEIGLSHGPRLWDLRGFEYFWGVVHPVLMDLLFLVTGSVDIVLARLLSLAFGTVVVVLIFVLCHRYWGTRVAIVAAGFAALSPVSVFNDDMGMVEPIAIALILFGIWLSPRKGFWAGVAWGLAAMARVEAWLFTAGLVVAVVIGRRSATKALPTVVGWVAVMGVYLKFLLDQTGNAIYPFYWNFHIVAFGSVDTPATFTRAQELLRIPLGLAVVAAAAGLVWTLRKGPPSYLLLTYGYGYWVFQAGTLGFTAFLHDTTDWMYRRFEFPLDFTAILVAVLLFKVLPKFQPQMRPIAWVASAAALLVVQVSWLPIAQAYAATESSYRDQVRLGRAVGAVYSRSEFRGGVIAVPGNAPTLVYTMVRDGGVPGARLTSEFYDPFYYLPAGYRYVDHKDVAGPLIQCWLANTRTRLLLIPTPSTFNSSVPDYRGFIADNPQWFSDTGAQLGGGLEIVAVQVPVPAPGTCSEAAKAAPH